MPQMMPLYWLMLYIYMLIMLFLFMVIFNSFILMINKKKDLKKLKLLNFKFMW